MRPPSVPTSISIGRDDSKQLVIMKHLYNTLIEYREAKTNRILIQLFMSLPSRKDFPDYFNIINKPIAMNKIRERIERQLYPDVASCLEDFKLLFDNCKTYNEDDSQIYRDAELLEDTLFAKKDLLLREYHMTSSTNNNSNSINSNSNNYNNNTSAGRPSRDSKEAAREIILNATTNNKNNSSNSKHDRLNHSYNANSNSLTSTTQHSNNSSNSTTTNNMDSSTHFEKNSTAQASSLASKQDSSSNNNNHNINSNHTTSRDRHQDSPKANNIINSNSNNGITRDNSNSQQSDSTNYSTNEQLQNGNGDLDSSNLKINHNHHNEASMDSSSNLSADLLASTPIEKCSLNTRRGKNADAPKRQLLTGYIIYASEIRKQVIDKNPNQNFGDISRLVGNEWKALPHDIRSKYDQRALIHNKRVRERAQRELSSPDVRLTNGFSTPKLTKRKLAKLAKEQMKQHHLSFAGHDDSSMQSPKISQEHSSNLISQASTHKSLHHHHSQLPTSSQISASKTPSVEASTQTTAIRFVEPPTKKRLVYSETFRKYIESLQVPNKDLLAEETAPQRPPELPTNWLGAGIGRYDSPEAALWALRDFMLQDAVTMRRSMEPYL